MKKIPQITDSEWKVMKVLWSNGPTPSSEILLKLKPNVSWCVNTVISLLNRLIKKGAVKVSKNKQIKEYEAIIQENDCMLVESKNFLSKLYDGSLNMMVSRFIEEDQLSEEEISELIELLNKKGK